jgi:four helix bundle protein
MAFKFEKLKVWQRAVDLSGEIYELIERFPKKEMFVLTSQIQRASDSIALNIAEGSTGKLTRSLNVSFQWLFDLQLRLLVVFT